MAYDHTTGAALGAGRSGLAGTVGYRVLDAADGTTVVVAFTTAGVAETAVPGHYTPAGGHVTIPTGTGRAQIQWGDGANWWAEEWVEVPPTLEEAAAAVVDQSLAGHTAPGTVGGSLGQVTLAAGTVATGTSTTSFTATIAGSTLSPTTGAYDGMRLLFQSGLVSGEAGVISTYVVASGIATLTFTASEAFTVTPAGGVTFVIG